MSAEHEDLRMRLEGDPVEIFERCKSCDGHEADVGPVDENRWCERCSYRDALSAIVRLCEGSWRHEQVRDLAARTLNEWSSS